MVSNFQILNIAGITNLVFLFLVFFSCRCLGGHRVLERLFKNSSFMRFYKLHCYFWWGFFISVIIHTFMAFSIFGLSI